MDVPQLDDDKFLASFRSATLSPAAFTHEAHLRLGWIHLSREPQEQAIDSISTEIRHFVRVHGKEDKYHHTLTVAAMHILATRMNSGKEMDFRSFLLHNPDLLTDLRGLIGRHYTLETLADRRSALEWVEPDLENF
jgi:hypothetical protein